MPEAREAMAIDALLGLRPWALDVFVYTPDEIARLKDVVGSLVHTAEQEGTVLFQAP